MSVLSHSSPVLLGLQVVTQFSEIIQDGVEDTMTFQEDAMETGAGLSENVGVSQSDIVKLSVMSGLMPSLFASTKSKDEELFTPDPHVASFQITLKV